MPEITFIGEEDNLKGWGKFFVSAYSARDAREAEELLSRLRRERIPLVLITEPLAKGNEELIAEINQSSPTTVVVIPLRIVGKESLGRELLREAIKSAVGVDFLSAP